MCWHYTILSIYLILGVGLHLFKKKTYKLKTIKDLLKDPNKCIVTFQATKDAYALGYCSKMEIIERVLKLKEDEIYKTMSAEKMRKLYQDVYKTSDNVNGKELKLYIKVQISYNRKGVVISFKEDTDI